MRLIATFAVLATLWISSAPAASPNIVLVMADDQGWGQTGYYKHPVLKTPHLDAMAESGLRFDRFYAAAPVCSPTRASVLTGRSNRRTGVESHGFALRLQEKTLAAALAKAGYATGHFGKWHLNGLRGPGVPILPDDTHHPGRFGFQKWLSVTNYFDRDPLMAREGEIEEFAGDSSEIIVAEALKFIEASAKAKLPSFTVIWYGTPHSPFHAAEEDMKPFADLDKSSMSHYGELVAMDRSIGALRRGLRDIGIAKNTLVWFTSDNGGLPKIKPSTVGGLRGNKGTIYEGGLRVPGILEWPAGISVPRITKFPSIAMDIFPTLAAIAGLPESSMLKPIDGINLKPLLDGELPRREMPLRFSCLANTAINDNGIKLLHFGKKDVYELYDLAADPAEENNLWSSRPELAERMLGLMNDFKASMARSIAGEDYPEKMVKPENPSSRFWTDDDRYKPFFDQWRSRPEYASRLSKREKKPKK